MHTVYAGLLIGGVLLFILGLLLLFEWVRRGFISQAEKMEALAAPDSCGGGGVDGRLATKKKLK